MCFGRVYTFRVNACVLGVSILSGLMLVFWASLYFQGRCLCFGRVYTFRINACVLGESILSGFKPFNACVLGVFILSGLMLVFWASLYFQG